MPQVPPKLYSLLTGWFQGDKRKAMLWFEVSNPMLNGLRPKDYHQNGNYDLLERKIEMALKEVEDERTKQSCPSDS